MGLQENAGMEESGTARALRARQHRGPGAHRLGRQRAQQVGHEALRLQAVQGGQLRGGGRQAGRLEQGGSPSQVQGTSLELRSAASPRLLLTSCTPRSNMPSLSMCSSGTKLGQGKVWGEGALGGEPAAQQLADFLPQAESLPALSHARPKPGTLQDTY